MKSPVQKKIGMVFVPVRDLPAAIQWYRQLFGLPTAEPDYEGQIYGMPMQAGVDLCLDGNHPGPRTTQPLCFFLTGDIKAADAFLRGQGISIVQPVEDLGELFTLTFQDPDGNVLMLCQNKTPAASA